MLKNLNTESTKKKWEEKENDYPVVRNSKRSPFDFAQGPPSTSLRDRGFWANMCEFFAKKIPLKN